MSHFDDSVFDLRKIMRAKKTTHAHTGVCDKFGCNEQGVYKAPKSPKNLKEQYHFCLNHVRDYNKSWNFFEGCSDDFFTEYALNDRTGHRPTWPMGNIPNTGKQKPVHAAEYFKSAFADPFDLGSKIFGNQKNDTSFSDIPKKNIIPCHIEQACYSLGVDYPPDWSAVRKAYKAGVKKNHPDVNKHDKDNAEKRLKDILNAFRILEKHFSELS